MSVCSAAIVVPEYRTEYSRGGGLASVAEFMGTMLVEQEKMEVSFFSVRMSRRAPESRRLLAPWTWLRGPLIREVRDEHGLVYQCGVDAAELELLRYRAPRRLRKMLSEFDVVVVVGGSPVAFGLLRGLPGRTAGQVATLVREERAKEISELAGYRRMLANMHVRLITRVEKSAASVPDVVLVENQKMFAFMEEFGARCVVNIPPGVDVDFFSPGRVLSEGDPYILSVGRLNDPRKNFGGLLRAYARARAGGLSHRLVLAGLYDLLPADRLLIEDLGLTPWVAVRRDLAREQLRDLYRGASAFVLASTEEGLGIAILEAMACGVPVVASGTVGAREILGGRFAESLVPLGPDFEGRLGEALVAASREGTALGEAMRGYVVERFSARGCGERMATAIRGR